MPCWFWTWSQTVWKSNKKMYYTEFDDYFRRKWCSCWFQWWSMFDPCCARRRLHVVQLAIYLFWEQNYELSWFCVLSRANFRDGRCTTSIISVSNSLSHEGQTSYHVSFFLACTPLCTCLNRLAVVVQSLSSCVSRHVLSRTPRAERMSSFSWHFDTSVINW